MKDIPKGSPEAAYHVLPLYDGDQDVFDELKRRLTWDSWLRAKLMEALDMVPSTAAKARIE